MKKTKLLTCALLLASFAILAQTTEKKQAKVRVKKVENINGVEKVTDTSYTTDAADLIISGDKIITEDIKNENGMLTKTIIIDDKDGKGEPQIKVHTGDPTKDAQLEKELREMEKNGGMKDKIIIMDNDGKGSVVRVLDEKDMEKAMEEAHKALKEAEKEMKAGHKELKRSEKEIRSSEQAMKEAEKAMLEAEKEMEAAHKNGECKQMKKVIIVHDTDNDNGKGQKSITKIVMLNMDIKDASPEDVKRLKTQLGNVDNKVEMENMKLYPNPNDGKFNLNFNLKSKGDAEVTVYNVEGKQVYNEKLLDFQGEYNKPIDISSNAKGIYFVKIRQGDHTQVKKISLD
jgi:hypothetical protein